MAGIGSGRVGRRVCLLAAGALAAGRVFARDAAPADLAVAAVLRDHAVLVAATYDDTLGAARALHGAVEALLAAPDAARLDAAREAWRTARDRYGLTEAFRFYGGPIDGADGPEGRMNAWPVDESTIDGVVGRPNSGLVNDRRVPLNRKTLLAMHQRGGEENVVTGWHAIEFMLWGQDLSDDGPGQRPADDFIDGQAPNADRRRRYLAEITALLVDDLAGLVRAWAPDAAGRAGGYRGRFERGGLDSLRKLWIGLGSLARGELAGERLEVPLATRDQEDEQSCFSDHTHRDLIANVQGLVQVWTARQQRPDGSTWQGASPQALLAARDAALAGRADRLFEAALAAAHAIVPPFDREIQGGADGEGRQRVQQLSDRLVELARVLAEAAGVLGLRTLTWVTPRR